ncbi:MAG: MBL fold metallo-hydrolase [Gammaproteobacteria bacterium]|nr:MBL fold metallo-hydrolase [Gammaproteobacteria bacterium]
MKYHVIPVTDFSQNCSVIWCENTLFGAVIDPGGDIEKILCVIKTKNLTISTILLTHGHIDHVGGAAALSKRLTVPVTGPHKADNYWLHMLPEEAELFAFPELEVLVPDQWLKDKDQVTIGTVKLDVIHCPGHTPGHVVFYHADSKTAFVGDVIFKDSVGRTDFEGGSEPQLMHSIMHKLLPLGDDVTFISGHGAKSTFGREKRRNPFLIDVLTTS